MNDEKKVICCGVLSSRLYSFQVNPDLMYQATVRSLGPTPVQIYSRRQWKRELKKNGLTDNFGNPMSCYKSAKEQTKMMKPLIKEMAKDAYYKAEKEGFNPKKEVQYGR